LVSIQVTKAALGIREIARILAVVLLGNIVVSNRRYFVTGLDLETVTAHDILKHFRNHLRIENCLYFTKDRW